MAATRMLGRLSGAAALGLMLCGLQAPANPAWADNAMGYKLLSPDSAAQLPRNHGALGLDVDRDKQITDGGMTFDLMRVKQVRPGSAGARAGFRTGDEIIAVDGQVFPSIATFAAYIGSVTPGGQINVDYIPSGGGPAQAQRLVVVVGAAGQVAQPAPQAKPGLSTGTKVAIGVGAVALLGCYEMGCFSHRTPPPQQPPANGMAPAQPR